MYGFGSWDFSHMPVPKINAGDPEYTKKWPRYILVHTM